VPATAFPVPWRWWDAFVVFVLIQVALLLVGFAAALLLGQEVRFSTFAALSSAVTALLTLLWVRASYPGQTRRLLGPVRVSAGDLLPGVGAGIVAFLVANVGLTLLVQLVVELVGGEVPEVQETLQEALVDPAQSVVVTVAVVVFAPLGEELLFRGLLFQALRNRVRLWPAMLLSGLLFAASHVEPLAILVLSPVGVFFAWVFHRRGSLLVPIVAHATFNLVNVLLLQAGLQ
jgi:membrane protease YdiL (CAAX protease family)